MKRKSKTQRPTRRGIRQTTQARSTAKLGKRPNTNLLALIITLLVFGTIMIFDASVYVASRPPFNNEFYFLQQHLIWLFIGLIPALVIYFLDYRKIAKIAVPILIVNILLLVAVLALGDVVNGSRRWFSVAGIPIQPAEFIKLTYTIYLGAWLGKQSSKTYKSFKDALKYGFGELLLKFSILLVLILGLIILEPDLGTTMIVGITAFSIFLAAGKDNAHTVGSAIVAGILSFAAGIAAIFSSYRLERVKTYLHILFSGEVADISGSGYQMYQIILGIAAAGWRGVGFGQSRQRFGYLVENTAFTDSIFAVYLEELGLIGGILLIGAWIMFFLLGMEIARKAPDRVGRLMAIGITTWLTIQALLNMAANVGLIPLTGMPLPFFTYGGSNTIITMSAVALLLNISRAESTNKRR